MNWLYLILAAICEVGWPLGFKMSTLHPADKWMWLVMGMLSYAVSGWLLYLAQRTIPISTAYIIWTGAGALCTFLLGVWLFDDAATVARVFFAFLILVGIVGLELSTK